MTYVFSIQVFASANVSSSFFSNQCNGSFADTAKTIIKKLTINKLQDYGKRWTIVIKNYLVENLSDALNIDARSAYCNF